MTNRPAQGTAIRVSGIPSADKKRQTKGSAGVVRSDRWTLSNAIDDQLGWMPDGEHRVLRVLFRHADKNGKAWPGQTGIAASCGCHQGSVSRRLKRLAKWGILEIVRRGHFKSLKAAEYRIRPPTKWPRDHPPE